MIGECLRFCLLVTSGRKRRRRGVGKCYVSGANARLKEVPGPQLWVPLCCAGKWPADGLAALAPCSVGVALVRLSLQHITSLL